MLFQYASDSHNGKPWYHLSFVFLLLVLLTPVQALAVDVPQWSQFRIEFTNSTLQGNPFDLDFEATFTHEQTGRSIRQFGFYAGENVWKIYFMPDATGNWSYDTNSTDPDLDGQAGTFAAVESQLYGPVVADSNYWTYANGNNAFPVVVSSAGFWRTTSLANGASNFIDWAYATAGATMIHSGQLFYFDPSVSHVGGEEALPFVAGEHPTNFNVRFWDRMNEHFDYLREKNMGVYVMFFTDDAQTPDRGGITAESNGALGDAERRLFRYTIARFAAYPNVIWDTGVDISEYRTNEWIANFVAWFRENDGWNHPIGSRSGGGSGGFHPSSATYYSDGRRNMPEFNALADAWRGRQVPTLLTDRFRENFTRGDFDRRGIRRAAWQSMITGATGLMVSGNENSGYLGSNYESDFEAAPDVGHTQAFFRRNLTRAVDRIRPDCSIVVNSSSMYCGTSDSGKHVVYLPPGGPSEITVSPPAGSQQIQATWYDPTDGTYQAVSQSISNTGNTRLDTPGSNNLGDGDWVLYIETQAGSGSPRPNPPTSLEVSLEVTD